MSVIKSSFVFRKVFLGRNSKNVTVSYFRGVRYSGSSLRVESADNRQ